jgi:GNAT superfamily N-acetyltransferase
LGEERFEPLRLLARSSDGQLVAGLLADLYFEWLYVAILWVREDLRGQGIGRRLMATIEEYAAAHGRLYAHVDTFDFQAPEFYKRLGYTVFGELGPYGDGHTRFYLRKALSSGPGGAAPGADAQP